MTTRKQRERGRPGARDRGASQCVRSLLRIRERQIGRVYNVLENAVLRGAVRNDTRS